MRLILKALILFAFLVVGSSLSAQERYDLTLPQVRSLAQTAALTGNFPLARRLAARLLEIDPNDRAALIVLAAVEPQLGRPDQGRLAGARAWRVSETAAQKYEAARLTSLAAANAEQYTLAQIWLRRASTVAPNDQDLAQTRRDFQGLRQLNPWQTNIVLRFAPSNNLNGGSDSPFNTIDEFPGYFGRLSGDAQALSGVSGSAELRMEYRIAATQNSRTSVDLSLYSRGVLLSQDAKELVPNHSNADFANSRADLTFTHQRNSEAGLLSFTLKMGSAWTARELTHQYMRLGVDHIWALNDTDRLSVGASYEQRWDGETGQVDGEIRRVQVGYSLNTAAGNRISATLSFRDYAHDSGQVMSQTSDLQISYRLKEPIGSTYVSFSAGLQSSHYPDYKIGIFDPADGRRDKSVSAGVELFFPEMNFAGFAPTLSLSANHIDSNFSRFDRTELGVSIGIRSSF